MTPTIADINRQISTFFRVRRVIAGISVEEVAQALDLPYQTVELLELGFHRYTVDQVRAIATILRYDGSGDPWPQICAWLAAPRVDPALSHMLPDAIAPWFDSTGHKVNDRPAQSRGSADVVDLGQAARQIADGTLSAGNMRLWHALRVAGFCERRERDLALDKAARDAYRPR